MKPVSTTGRWLLNPALLLAAAVLAGPRPGFSAANAAATKEEIRIVALQGRAEVRPAGAPKWYLTQTNQVLDASDRVRVGTNSRISILFADQSVVTFGALTEFEILPPRTREAESGLRLISGILSFFHRSEPGHIRIISRGADAGVKGTEFVMAVEPTNDGERTTIWVIDGQVRFSNEQGELDLTNDEKAFAELGKSPMRTAGFVANNVLQWCFYYPAVLDPGDVPFTPEEQRILGESLAAYRAGDLLAALDKYPAARQPGSDAERVYYAALVLSVGQVENAEAALAAMSAAEPSERLPRVATALRQLIAAVKRQPNPATLSPQLPTEYLAASYYEQSRAVREDSLRTALNLAYQAVTNSPEFGFAWERVAELEFSFGQTERALNALNWSLTFAPRNAQARALKGFLLAAQNKTPEAIALFNQAIALDSALGNAWLGRGLCRIRRGDARGGREDLLVAAALEPQRAGLRSYLGKAYANAGDYRRAAQELQLAMGLDPADPTAWLYSALLKQQENRINEGIRDLEKSQELNENRRLYRSRLLLDQDRAVRSANLARIYADADLGDVAVREAGRGVTADYANYSAHVFLANSYEVERRANLSNLRFEAASFSEYLLANLLGPANGQLLAQPVTQLEYSQLFERNRFGLIANTEYFSRGAWHVSGAQYGTMDGSSYSLEAEYRTDPGERVNQDLEIRQLEGKFKHDITPDDSVYLHVVDYRAKGGDTAQYFDENNILTEYRFEQEQTPNVLLGYRHQWSPNHHTLLLGGYFNDTVETATYASSVLAADRTTGTVIAFAPVDARLTYGRQVELCSAELQHTAQTGRNTLIVGARGQWSKQSVTDRVEDPSGDNFFLLGIEDPVSGEEEEFTTSSAAIYAYDYVELTDTLQLAGGLNYTHQSIPVNKETAPVSSERDDQDRLSPKAGIIWSPSRASTIRASYTMSLTGSELGQSVRLEPTQVAGLLQTFRAPVPPALVGELSGADLETAECLWEGHYGDTYLSVGAQWLVAERTRQQGLFLADDPDYVLPPSRGLIQQRVSFRERALDLSLHQLVDREWSFGVRYRLGYAQLEQDYPEYPGLGVGLDDSTDWRGWLHTLSLSGLYRHRSGVFVRGEGVLFAQDREQEGASVPGDNFWQVNLIAGYRFPKQKAEIAIGCLNILDQDYRLDPINQHADQPRSRTFYARLLLNF